VEIAYVIKIDYVSIYASFFNLETFLIFE